MKYQDFLEVEVTDVHVEFNDFDRYEVCVCNIDEDQFSETLGEFSLKSDALVFAMDIFQSIHNDEKMMIVLDITQPLEMLAFSEDKDIGELIQKEISNGN